MTAPEILLIEDRQDDRDLFEDAVRRCGLHARVVHAGDAAEAVVRLNRLGTYGNAALPALILLDLGLPGLKGTTLLQVIRTAYGPREVPVVVLTGSHNAAARDACESWGISEFMVKPDNFDDLVRMVKGLERYLPSSEESGEHRRRPAEVIDEREDGG